MHKLLLLIMLLPATVYSQETNVDPIDKALDTCTDKNPPRGWSGAQTSLTGCGTRN